MFCLHIWFVYYVSSWCPRGPEEVSDPLGLELQMVVSHCLSTENLTWVLCKSSKCF